MITKLTAENSGRYYAPAFELINQALAAAGKSLRINSIEEYFNNLTTDIIPLLVNKHIDPETQEEVGIPGGYLLLMPADEEIFEIDANTRTINIPSMVKKNGIGVYGDHNAEMLVLAVDRYFDSQDLLNTNIAINWSFTPFGSKSSSEVRAVPAFAPNCDLNAEKVTFGFIIDKNMTGKGKGILTFSVTFYTTKSGDIDYSLNTLTASVNINDTLTLLDPKIIEDDIDNYLGRFSNSSYQDNTIQPIGNPVWKSGELKDHIYSGLKDKEYLNSEEDLYNSYQNGAPLYASAMVNPATAEITYKWTVSPLDGTIPMGNKFITQNRKSEYIKVAILPDEDSNELYYLQDEAGNVDPAQTPMTLTEAKAYLDSMNDDQEDYLPLTVQKIITVADDDNQELSQMNQDNLRVAVNGNIVTVKAIDELNSFASTNESQGTGKWIGFDINTGLSSIIGVKWNGYELSNADVLESRSIGLPNGHIVFWAKAENITEAPKVITLSADGYLDTTFKVQYIGVEDDQSPDVNTALEITNIKERKALVIKGSSYNAIIAGKYQVSAQARIGVGNDDYIKVLDNAILKVGVKYYKEINGEIDKEHPVINTEATEAQKAGIPLYVHPNASRNSEEIGSSILTIPPAIQPIINLKVTSEFKFDEDENAEVQKAESFDEEKYTYIDDNIAPVIEATIVNEVEDSRDLAGAFAAELIQKGAPILTKESIESKIIDGSLVFDSLPEDRKFTFVPEDITAGEYLVRIVNRRNGTYSVSDDSENAKVIHTSFVAPASNNITITAAPWADPSQPRPDDAEFTRVVLNNGKRTQDNIDDPLCFDTSLPCWTFNMVDNTVIDRTKYEELPVRTYVLEEVNFVNGEIVPRVLTEEQRNNNVNPYETYGNPDLQEIGEIKTEDDGNTLTFSITDDPGTYRIKVISYYHDTIHTSYTDIFRITSY